MNVVITVKNGAPQERELTGRAAEIVVWLAEIGDSVTRSKKGHVHVDFAGKVIKKSFLQIEERGGRE